jgi:hypothetical protein
MKNVLLGATTTLLLAVGLAAAPQAHAGAEGIGRFVYGIECDESMAGASFDDGEAIYYCDGREWYIVGRL